MKMTERQEAIVNEARERAIADKLHYKIVARKRALLAQKVAAHLRELVK